MATAQKCYSIACVRPATHRVRGVLGGDVTPKDYCEPCAQQYAAVSVALGAGAEVTPIEPPAPEPAQGADGEVAAKSAVERPHPKFRSEKRSTRCAPPRLPMPNRRDRVASNYAVRR